MKLARARVKAGLDTLLEQPGVDATRVAAIGCCFGGTMALELARAGAKLAGVVSFHGGLATPNAADGRSWEAMKTFFAEIVAATPPAPAPTK